MLGEYQNYPVKVHFIESYGTINSGYPRTSEEMDGALPRIASFENT
jgi:hypothetical protein